jgi:ABC-type transporter Mla maintaining outer membrane lipid asymmetry permease subunit MlaE
LLAGAGRRVSRRLKGGVLAVQEWGLLAWSALRALATRPRPVAEILTQMDSLGVGSLSIVILTGVFTGMELALQSSATLDAFGARIRPTLKMSTERILNHLATQHDEDLGGVSDLDFFNSVMDCCGL